ncbi:unnamed protein product [Rhizoctonia solani]|uniref:Uncharacterized protein n=1 Tax=Rhizoctonia solani TaxID=456999 RepID=A0A8H3CZD7_9AGAM|nr:unnamed protein product [Rhizoctonia solani]
MSHYESPRRPMAIRNAGICHFPPRPGGCIYGRLCRLRHVSQSSVPTPDGSVDLESTNNQNVHPDDIHPSGPNSTTTYLKHPKFYYPDGSGVFLVGGILFKIQASLIFGCRPAAGNNDSNHMYIEDVLPNLANSNDSHPIQLDGITASQFEGYLVTITSRPGDKSHRPLYRQETELYKVYLDTAVLAGRFGMAGLEEWAMDALFRIFQRPCRALINLASQHWNGEVMLQLINISRNTRLNHPIVAFVQYFISVNIKEIAGETIDKDKPPVHPNALVCVHIYNVLKDSNSDPALFGFVFLSLLSLGHRSPIWSSNLSGRDRAIFYAAQAQLIDTTKELSLKWLQPNPTLDSKTHFCPKCRGHITALWKQCFGALSNGLGSGLPLKDVSLLSSLPQSAWRFRMEWYHDLAFGCKSCIGNMRSDWGARKEFLHSLEANTQTLFEEVASRYGAFAREVQDTTSI